MIHGFAQWIRALGSLNGLARQGRRAYPTLAHGCRCVSGVLH